MAVKRKGLGKGLDSLIPENKSVKPAAKAEKRRICQNRRTNVENKPG